jgi:protocadherin Fat 4
MMTSGSDNIATSATQSATVVYSNPTPVMTLENLSEGVAETAFLKSRIKVADIVITDGSFTAANLSLTGTNALSFELNGLELFLRGGRAFDFETMPPLNVTVVLDNPSIGTGPELTAQLNFPIIDINEPPQLSLSTTAITLFENTETVTRVKVADLLVTDDALGEEVFTLSGSGAALFEIDGHELFIRAGADLDFETLSMPTVTIAIDDPTLGTGPEGSATLTLTLVDVNDAPVVTLQNVTSNINENTDTTSRIKVADIVVTDDALGTATLSLSGAQAGFFQIDGTGLYLNAGTTIDFETRSQFAVNVDVNDPTIGGTPDNSAPLTLQVNDLNEAPFLALANTVSTLAENTPTTVRTKLADILVVDDALGQNTLTLTGTDAPNFEIIGNALYLRAGIPLNFESKAAFDVSIVVDDPTVGVTPDATFPYRLTVTDVNEPPAVSVTQVLANIAENANTATRTKVADIALTDDALGTAHLGLSGADASFFVIDGTELFLVAGAVLDFEADSTLTVSVTATDPTLGSAPQSTKALTLPVLNVNEPPTVTLTNRMASLSEQTGTVLRIKVADIVVTDDAIGSRILALTGPDAARFEIADSVLYLKAGTQLDFETAPQLNVTVTVDDPALGTGPESTASFVLPIVDSNESPTVALANSIGSIAENADTRLRTKVADIVVTDDALGNNRLGLGGSDSGFFEIIGTELFLKSGVSLNFETKSIFSARVTVNDQTLPPDPNADVAIGLMVSDVNEAPSLALSNIRTVLTESLDTTNPVRVADITVTDDALGTNNLTVTGANAALFEIAGNGLFLKAGTMLEFGITPSLQVFVQLDDPTIGTSFESSSVVNFTVQDTVRTGTSGNDLIFGTALSDKLFGLDGNDTLVGLASDDILDGGAGIDVAVLTAQQKNYTLTFSTEGITIEDRRAGGAGTDTLIDIEQLRFSSNPTSNPNSGTLFDLTIFDGVLDASPEQLETLTLLYMALYDRAPDALGLYYWATYMSAGLDIDIITQAFIDSPEAIQIYGAAPTAAEIVEKAYENVLQRTPDPAGAQFWTSLIEQKIITPAEYFALFAEGVQNNPGAGDDRQTLADQTDIGLYFSAIRGLSNAHDATAAMATYDATDREQSLITAQNLIDNFLYEALSTGPSGEFIVPVVGIVEDPFALG